MSAPSEAAVRAHLEQLGVRAERIREVPAGRAPGAVLGSNGPRCAGCGYSLRGLSVGDLGVSCPECGSLAPLVFQRPPGSKASRESRWGPVRVPGHVVVWVLVAMLGAMCLLPQFVAFFLP